MSAQPKSSAAEWRQRAAAVQPRTQAFIDGRFVPAVNGATFDNIDPATGKSLGPVAAGDEADIDRAVAAARAAFRKGVWANQPPKARKKVLIKLADLMLKHREELALLETLDVGKPISDSLAVEPTSARFEQIRVHKEADRVVFHVIEVHPRGFPNEP